MAAKQALRLLLAALLAARASASAGRSVGTGALQVEGASASGRQRALGQEFASANPIRKVVALLQSMARKVEQEGKKEAELFQKFVCYCHTGVGDLQASITGSSAKVPAFGSSIEGTESSVSRLKQELKQHSADLKAAGAAMSEATSLREKERATYQSAAGDLRAYMDSVKSATKALRTGMTSGGFVQLSGGASEALRRAAAADVLITEDDRQAVLSLVSSTSTDGYVPKSGEVLDILESMQEDFGQNLAALDKKEAEAGKIYEELMAAKTKEAKSLGASIDKKTARVGELQMQVVQMKNDLSSTEAALLEDQKSLADLQQDCGGKKSEYDERVKLRGEELVAIHETIEALNSDDALELFKKTLPSPSFVQLRAGLAQVQRRAVAAVQRAGKAVALVGGPDVRFLELMLHGQKADFSKVLTMIDNMIALLSEEQSSDDAKKEYCGKQIRAAAGKAKDLSRTAGELAASLEERKAAMDQLAEDIKVLQRGLAALDGAVADATAQRKQENEEYTELMSSDSAAVELLHFAKKRLSQFYSPKAALLAQASRAHRRRLASSAKAREAPAPPPATWGAYQKKDEESSGVIAMIEILVRDLNREMAEAKVQERESQKAYEDLMSDSAEKRAVDVKSMQVKQGSMASAEEAATAEKGELSATKKELLATEKMLSQLHGECDWLVQNFELRRSARTEELDNLKGAKVVLSSSDVSLLQARDLRGRRALQAA